MRELTHTALSDDLAGRIGLLYDASVRGDTIVVCGYGGAALFKTHQLIKRYVYLHT